MKLTPEDDAALQSVKQAAIGAYNGEAAANTGRLVDRVLSPRFVEPDSRLAMPMAGRISARPTGRCRNSRPRLE
jgi:hypothetical protein